MAVRRGDAARLAELDDFLVRRGGRGDIDRRARAGTAYRACDARVIGRQAA